MGFLDALLGRSKPKKPDLDRLFALPTAAVTLEAAAGLKPTGVGAVCFRAAEGAAFAQIEADVRELLDAGSDGPKVELSTDSYGYTWLVTRHEPTDLEEPERSDEQEVGTAHGRHRSPTAPRSIRGNFRDRDDSLVEKPPIGPPRAASSEPTRRPRG